MRRHIIALTILSALLSFHSFHAEAGNVVVTGTMQTTADMVDDYIVRVPQACHDIEFQLPVPTQSEAPVFGVSANATAVLCASDLKSASSGYVRDKFDNVYKVLTFRNVAPGIYRFQATFRNLDIVSDVSQPLPARTLPFHSSSDVPGYCLQASSIVQCNSPIVRRLAAKLTRNVSTESGASVAISAWMQQNIIYGSSDPSANVDAISTLRSRHATCEGWADLFIALARASGIPARFVGGYSLGGRIVYPTSADGLDSLVSTSTALTHAWVELWYTGVGWVPYEPQQTAGFVDSHHFSIWTGADAHSDLPLLIWHGANSETQTLSYVEEEKIVGMNDDINLQYSSGISSSAETTLICRADR